MKFKKPFDQPGRDEIISYQKLRTFIGLVGLMLPLLLVLGCLIFGAGRFSFQPSISHYYYSYMHFVFVGLLSLLGGFFLNYRGKSAQESGFSNFAGLLALAVAALPTTFNQYMHSNHNRASQYLQLCTPVESVMANVHNVCAALLFVCFAVFCLKYFQVRDDEATDAESLRKFGRRRRLYTICGIGILVSLAVIIVFINADGAKGWWRYRTFIFETTGLFCFGIAWLVKGSAYWKNMPVIGALITPLR